MRLRVLMFESLFNAEAWSRAEEAKRNFASLSLCVKAMTYAVNASMIIVMLNWLSWSPA